jgi:hypothetical protein
MKQRALNGETNKPAQKELKISAAAKSSEIKVNIQIKFLNVSTLLINNYINIEPRRLDGRVV